MDAVSLINEHLDIDKLLNHYRFEEINADNTIIRSCCKLHGGSNKTGFAINRETGLWYCHTGGCGGGDVYTLIEQLEKIPFPEAVEWAASFFDVTISGLQIIERKVTYLDELKSFIKLMKKQRKPKIEEFHIEEPIKEVVKYRNFKSETLKFFNLGYVAKVSLRKRNQEQYTLHNRLVFPIIFDGVQVGLSFRRLKHSDYPKWSHQPVQINTGDILYNYDNCKHETSIVVCEGITDVWAYHEIGIKAVATFGAHLTDQQYKLLLKTGADLILSYDGDDAGRTATQKALKLLKNKANLSIIHFEEGEDPESIDREELEKRVVNKRKTT